MKNSKFCLLFSIQILIGSNLLSTEKFTFLRKDNLLITHLIKSPLNDNNIWVINNKDIAFEVNSETGNWTGQEYDLRLVFQRMYDTIADDKYHKEIVWYALKNNRLIAFDKTNESSNEFIFNKSDEEEMMIFKILPTEEGIWIGTSLGLYLLSRNSDKIEKILEIPRVGVWSILSKGNGNLILNLNSEYSPKNKTLVKIIEYSSIDKTISRNSDFFGFDLRDIWNIKIRNNAVVFYKENDDSKIHTIYIDENRKAHRIPFELDPYNFIADNDDFWFIEDKNSRNIFSYIKYNASNQKEQKVYLNNRCNNFFIGDSYIWFIDELGIGRIDKISLKVQKAILDPSIKLFNNQIFVIQGNYLWLEARDGLIRFSNNYLESLFEHRSSKRNMLAWLEKQIPKEENPYDYIKNCIRYLNLSEDPQQIEQMKNNLRFCGEWDRFRASEIYLESLENNLNNESDKQVGEGVRYFLFSRYKKIYNLSKALEHYEFLKKSNPDSMFISFINKEEINIMQYLKTKLDSIDITEQSEDYKLYEKAKILIKNHGDLNGDDPFFLLSSFVEKYPNSNLSDNAEYDLVKRNLLLSHEGESGTPDYEPYIKQLRELQLKYPDSELIPDFLYDISLLSFKQGSSIYDYSPQYYDKKLIFAARSTALNIINEYPNFHAIYETHQLLEAVNQFIYNYVWDLKIESSKGQYFVGERIDITFELKNDISKTRYIKLMENNSPNFSVLVFFSNKEELPDLSEYFWTSDSSNLEKTFNEKVLNYGEVYSENWGINTELEYNYNFNFEQEGYYYIVGTFRIDDDYVVLSDQIFIKIQDKNN
jgi:outer membrane protein assembly factor BamD (BamD/ComL family)